MNNSNNRKERRKSHEGHSLGEMVRRSLFRFSRRYQQSAEFNMRQSCLEFGDACRFVNDLISQVKATLTNYAKGVIQNFRMPVVDTKTPDQLRLNLLPWMIGEYLPC